MTACLRCGTTIEVEEDASRYLGWLVWCDPNVADGAPDGDSGRNCPDGEIHIPRLERAS